MTLAEIETAEGEVLTPDEVSKVLKVKPESIRLQARECPERLGFPVICIGNKVIIPKAGFIAHMRGIKL